MTAQYIGARYVPLFYTASDNSNNWEAGVQYDPLTIVTDLNQSYTSKKSVPASVGRPSENPEYWILTGAYNAQVEQYREEVQDVSERVTDLEANIAPEEETFLFISDSYGGTYGNDSGETRTIWDLLSAKLNMSGRVHYMTFSGCGFVNDTGGGTFEELVRANAASISANIDVTKLTKVIVVAGRNDYIASADVVVAAMQSFDNYIKATYPTAKTYYGYIANGDDTASGSKANQIMNSYWAYKRCTEFGGIYLNGVEAAIHVLNGLSGDHIHPSFTGKKAIASAVYEALMTGSYSATFPVTSPTFTANAGFTFVLGLTMNQLVENNNLYIFDDNIVCGISFAARTFAAFQTHQIAFATFTGGYIFYPFGNITIDVTMRMGTEYISAKLLISQNNIQLRFRTENNYTDITSVSFVTNDTKSIWPIVYC